MRVIVFSHIRLFGEALASCLMLQKENIDVIFCHLAEDLICETHRFKADIVLVDVTSEQALRETRAASLSCKEALFIALAVPEISKEVIACADAGFIAYVPRSAPLQELFQLMQMALKGECIGNPQIVGSLLREIRRRGQVAHTPGAHNGQFLTQRERQVLELLGHGLSNKAIASKLSVSLSTVKSHLHNTFSKLQVNCRADALCRIRNEPWLVQQGASSRMSS